MEFKDRLKVLREEASLSYSELAIRFGKTEAAVRAWEMGRTKPDTDTLIKLAQFFSCTTDYLLGISATRSPSKIDELSSELKEIEKRISIGLTERERLHAQIQEETRKLENMDSALKTWAYTRDKLKEKIDILNRITK